MSNMEYIAGGLVRRDPYYGNLRMDVPAFPPQEKVQIGSGRRRKVSCACSLQAGRAEACKGNGELWRSRGSTAPDIRQSNGQIHRKIAASSNKA